MDEAPVFPVLLARHLKEKRWSSHGLIPTSEPSTLFKNISKVGSLSLMVFPSLMVFYSQDMI
jgi:hypothetical protein